MAVIGTFKKRGDNYDGSIQTLAFQATNVTVKAVEKTKENAPSHKIYAGAVEIGAGWEKVSKHGTTYVSVKIANPGITPFSANLSQKDGGNYELIWTPPKSV